MDDIEKKRIERNKRKAETSRARNQQRKELAAQNGGVIRCTQEDGKVMQQCVRCGTWNDPSEFESETGTVQNCRKCRTKSVAQKQKRKETEPKTRVNDQGQTERQCTNCSTWSVCKFLNCDNCRASRNRCRDPVKNAQYQIDYRARKRAEANSIQTE